MMKKWWIDYGFCIILVCFIFYVSVVKIPSNMMPRIIIPHCDKVVHFFMYFALSAVICLSLLKQQQSGSWGEFVQLFLHKRDALVRLDIAPYFWLLAGLFPVFFGGLIEILQEYYFPPRTGDMIDFLADVAGVLCALALFILLNSKFGKYEQKRGI